jgi:hypothetical protein
MEAAYRAATQVPQCDILVKLKMILQSTWMLINAMATRRIFTFSG